MQRFHILLTYPYISTGNFVEELDERMRYLLITYGESG